MNEIKGGLVVNQLKQYAKKLSDYNDCSAMAEIVVWCHKYGDGINYHVTIRAYTARGQEHIEPRFKTENLKVLGEAIDDYIKGGGNG